MWIVPAGAFSSFTMGFVTFSVLGHLAHVQGVNITDVIQPGRQKMLILTFLISGKHDDVFGTHHNNNSVFRTWSRFSSLPGRCRSHAGPTSLVDRLFRHDLLRGR